MKNEIQTSKTYFVRIKDSTKEYVVCFYCIKNGFPRTNYKHGQVIHRRDKLKLHYTVQHPSEPVQEWSFADARNTKQRRLPFQFQPTERSAYFNTTEPAEPAEPAEPVEPAEHDVSDDEQAEPEQLPELRLSSSDTQADDDDVQIVVSTTKSLITLDYNQYSCKSPTTH